MKYLFDHWDQIKKKLGDKRVLFFFDYDGTLTPIAQTPRQAVIPKATKELLRKLSKEPDCKVAIISGRSLKDIKHIVGLKDVIYAGNHGFEIAGPKIRFSIPVPLSSQSVIRDIAGKFLNRLSGIKGVFIEDKGLTLSVHYRLVGIKDIPVFDRIFSDVTGPYAARGKIRVNYGKKVYEIKPPVKWDKGRVVLWLLAGQKCISGRKNVFPVYAGDDITDEDAFEALKKKGLTVFVGRPGISKADFYLKNTADVSKFLRLILNLRFNYGGTDKS
ncbi:MAG: trehalose-phosphatase [Candidatus Omnitrophota bacterium]